MNDTALIFNQAANLYEPAPAGIRPAAKEEIDHAAMVLRSLGNPDLARQIEKADPHKLANAGIVAVVKDFSDLPCASVLLIPPGTHHVPLQALDKAQYIIGLAWDRADYPVLMLQPDPASMAEQTQECVEVSLGLTKIAGVVLDAPRPTLIQTSVGGGLFSGTFFNVQWRPNVDALDVLSGTLRNGHEWAINAAYGPEFSQGRNALQEAVDALEEGGLNLIDSIFRPLVRWGEKMDRALGWD